MAKFAASLAGQKRAHVEVGGSSSRELVSTGGGGGHAPADATAKSRQAMVVSQLSESLAAFRKDRGVDAAAAPGAKKLSLKLFVPEQGPGERERNWVGIFIGREGKNKQRLEQETGATIYLRGEGTTLRSQPRPPDRGGGGGKGKGGGGGKGKGGGRGGGGGGRDASADDDAEAMHVLIEAESQEALDAARVKVLEIFHGRHGESSALALYDEGQITAMAMQKTTNTEECAFCGKPGHHHSKCPKRTTTFTMSGVKCPICGGGHTKRDCTGPRSQVAGLVPPGGGSLLPSGFEDDEFGAFEAELRRR